MTTFDAKPLPSADKLRGGYYTPERIASYVASWTATAGKKQLEPSCGDGAILRHLVKNVGKTHVIGVETVPKEAAKAKETKAKIAVGDFFEWFSMDKRGTFDGVAGNPPYIRFGNWPDEARARAFDLMRSVGMKPSKLTNAWVPFTVASVLALRPGGRVALVLPAELLQVGYAAPLRSFLVDHLAEATVVSFQRLVFPGILQEVVILLGVAGDGPARMSAHELLDVADLDGLDELLAVREGAPALLHDTEKWTKYFLTSSQIDLMRKLRSDSRIKRVSDYASVDVGVVTGRNSFFVMTAEEMADRGLESHCVPLVSKSNQVVGVRFTEDDLAKQEVNGAKCKLLALPGEPLKPRSKVAKYIALGESDDVQTGYKCSIRKFWFSVPSVSVPDAFMLRQIHTHPRITANHTTATSTDTVHRVRMTSGIAADQLATGVLNSLTFASSEVGGRSYGGGILELEPSEAEGLMVPPLSTLSSEVQTRADELIRSNALMEAVDLVDRHLLVEGLGLTWEEVIALRGIWERLRDRRSARGRSSKQPGVAST